MDEHTYADVLNMLTEMNQSQLTGLLSATEDEINRLHRFQFLCKQLVDCLDTIYAEFPNANVYLVKSPEEQISLLDYLIPDDFLQKWKIGD